MLKANQLTFDVAAALNLGKRDNQEDAIVADFPIGAGVGLVVLADGMGGHSAGEVASKIVVTEAFRSLKVDSGAMVAEPERIPEFLRRAAETANDHLSLHTRAHPDTRGMGATLIALVQLDDTLHWISVGDSVLYVIRDGQMRQLNEDHSLAPQIDFMVRQGMLSEEAGRDHPDRNCLTSALLGDEIPQIDCPDKPLKLRGGDVVVAASDGLSYLTRQQIAEILSDPCEDSSTAMASRLLRAIKKLNHPEQDNVCFSVIRVVPRQGAEKLHADFVPAREVERAAEPQPAMSFQPAQASDSLLGRLRSLRAGLLR